MRRDGARVPEETFSPTGKVTALPFQLPITRVNAEPSLQTVAVPALEPGASRKVSLPLRLESKGRESLEARLELDTPVVQANPFNDVVRRAVNVR